jgi:hypothetical protein
VASKVKSRVLQIPATKRKKTAMQINWVKQEGQYPAWSADIAHINLKATVADITCGDYEVRISADGLEEPLFLDYVCGQTLERTLEIAEEMVRTFVSKARVALAH